MKRISRSTTTRFRQHYGGLQLRAQPRAEATQHVGDDRELRARAGAEPGIRVMYINRIVDDSLETINREAAVRARTTFRSRAAILVLTECSGNSDDGGQHHPV